MEVERHESLYEQLIQVIQDRISRGVYKPGDQIPSEEKLSKEFDISRATVRTALSALVAENLLIKKQGVGTFISELGRIETGMEKLESVVSMANRQNSYSDYTDLSNERIPADSRIARGLCVSVGSEIHAVCRTILVDNERVSYQEDYVCPQWLSVEDVENEFKGSVLDLLLDKHNAVIDRAVSEFTSVMATAKLQKMLNVNVGAPLSLLTETVFSVEDKPMNYSINYFMPDRFTWKIVRR